MVISHLPVVIPGSSTPSLTHLLDLYSTKEDWKLTHPMYLVKLLFINSGWKACTLPTTTVEEAEDGHQRFLLPKADLYLDCRVIPNPFLVPRLGSLTGDNPLLQQWVLEHAQDYVNSFYQLIVDGVNQIASRRKGKDDPFAAPYVICTMCAHGIHRSRAMKHILSSKLKAGGWNVEVK